MIAKCISAHEGVQYAHMKRTGHLEVIAGPMYCGKTEELIRQVKRASIGKKKVQVYKHAIDTRYGKGKNVYSHAGLSFKSHVITEASEILKKLHKNTEIVAIDEAQWFGQDLIPVVNELLDKKIRVMVAGLAMTYERQPFAPMPTLMAMADKTTKLSAICSVCGEEAVFHKRIVKTTIHNPLEADPALVGRTDAYEARCRHCFDKP